VATDKGVLVRDLDSRNGTLVNQVRLEHGSCVYLTADARLCCGQTWLAFRSAGRDQVPVSTSHMYGRLVGSSVGIRRMFAQLAKISRHELSVLITGETGTGKELIAQAIHQTSKRSDGPLVTVDCTTIPAALAESKLFGHEKGAFTGAVARHVSPFHDARGGTIFFDELGELPLDVQAKLLRALEARQIQSVGSNRYEPIDVRVIAATRRNMHAEMNAKRFRDDLYFRFAQVVIAVPPLRDRPEDIPDLVERFLAELGDPSAMSRIDAPSMDALMRHEWPGNVRELRNVVTAAYAESDGGPILVADLLGSRGGALGLGERGSTSQSFHVRKRDLLDAFEQDFFARLYKETDGNLSEMSRRSGLSRPQVREYLERLGLRAPPGDGGAPPSDGG
jgi:DNA-binding NtrC family response regulator